MMRDKGDLVEFLPEHGRKKQEQKTIKVEVILMQKGRILCRKTQEQKVLLPAKSGFLGDQETEKKLIGEVFKHHLIKENLGKMHFEANHQEGNQTVKTYLFAAPPVSCRKGRYQWVKIEDLRDYQLSRGFR